MKKKTKFNIRSLKFDKNGLIPAIIQDYKSGEVLMLAYMNRESIRRTLKLGKTCFWSRSRKEYWVKGMTSGHFQFVKSLAYDCDMDALLIKVRQVGVACHTGNRSCFYRRIA
jgi:phosphoribosyl-AMP cyclohydrolase